MALCECGCEQETRPAPCTITRNGVRLYTKGEPQRFIAAHNRKNWKMVKKYRIVSVDNALDRRHIGQHQFLAEKALGHRLPGRAVVHHVDADRHAISPRLVICEDDTYHMLLHKRLRIQKAGGNPNTDKICTGCRLVKPQAEFHKNKTRVDGRADYCRLCALERYRDARRKKAS